MFCCDHPAQSVQSLRLLQQFVHTVHICLPLWNHNVCPQSNYIFQCCFTLHLNATENVQKLFKASSSQAYLRQPLGGWVALFTPTYLFLCQSPLCNSLPHKTQLIVLNSGKWSTLKFFLQILMFHKGRCVAELGDIHYTVRDARWRPGGCSLVCPSHWPSLLFLIWISVFQYWDFCGGCAFA